MAGKPKKVRGKAAKKKDDKSLRKLKSTEYWDPKSKTVKDRRNDPPPREPKGHHSWE